MTSELSLTRRLAKTGLMLVGLWFASTAWRASATVLIFESADGAFGNNLRIPDEYGDRVFEELQDGFRYGTDGGPTPNVQVEYGTGGFPGRALAWSVQFGDLVNVFEIEPEPSDFEMRLVADPGFQVLLHGFDLAGWPHASYTINTVRVSDEADNILFENKDATIWGSADDPMQHTSFDFQNPLLASTIKIYIDSSNLGERSDNIGTDNILFSQQRALSPALQAGDADQDLDFDQFDLLTVQNRGMYRSGQPATWGQGDWNGAPGGQPGRPPVGDGLFDALDLMAALRNGVYRTGSYAAVGKRDREVEFRASVSYDVTTGDISVEVPPETELTAVMLESADGIFTGQPQQAFSGVFDFVTEDTIFKATFGGSFGSLDFQNVARTGLDEEFLLGDLSVVGTLRGGGELGAVSLVYIPEPSALALLAIALVKLGVFRCRSDPMRVKSMVRRNLFVSSLFALVVCPASGLTAQDDDHAVLANYRETAMQSGDPLRGKVVFESKEAGCTKCHVVSGDQSLAGPDLMVVGDKYSREQMIQAVLEPNVLIHPDFGTVVVSTSGGKVFTGVLRKRTDEEMQLLDAESRLVRIPVAAIDQEQRSELSLMPSDLFKTLRADQFADLIAYLVTLRQNNEVASHHGLVTDIPKVQQPIRLMPLHSNEMRFDHPVWIISIPGTKGEYLVVEQKARMVWRLKKGESKDHKELFVDLSDEASTGEFEGVMCLAFHPRFRENRKYYINHHVRNQGSHFSPVIIERQATGDFERDAGVPSRRLLQIPQDTDLHWGGMLAFGPDGYLYIGAGDAGPQKDPEGHGQDMSLLVGKILRIDVDRRTGDLDYGIPDSNPFRDAGDHVRPEIWASGFRMPWRFSWDPLTGDMWVGEIGQNLFEEVSIVRLGENHGWNVYEGFTEFSDRYRREGEVYTPPVISYRRRHGVSVTGGYVYRGKRSPSYYGAYIFSDFESKRIWAATQSDRKLVKIRQIGTSPEQPSSFGVDSDGELFLVGYQGTIYRVELDDSVFE